MKLIPSAVLAVLVLSVELLLQEPLQDSGAWLAEHLQRPDWPVATFVAEQVGTWSGDILPVLGGAIYLAGNRRTGLMALTGFYVALGTAATLKILISHPRPYWVYPEVVAFDCPTDFGAPSGHATRVGATVLVLWACWRGNGKRRFLKALTAGLCLAVVALDRIYLGVHFYFQVVFGLAVGNFIASAVTHPKAQYWPSRTS